MTEQRKDLPDAGHEEMINDLEEVLQEAKDFAFHDFKNSDYAAPKVMFVEKLKMIATKAIDGKYDN